MRKVVDARQVCHLWANKSQDQARTPTGNLYFTGPTLYSYGSNFVIAHHLGNGRVLWNTASYSNTTSKQQSHARNALTRSQWDSALHVPSLRDDDVRELERVRRDGDGKRLPAMVQAIADGIVATVESMANMREGKGPESGAFDSIKQREASGLALCAYVAKGKRAPKWPLPPLPEVMPTGETRKAWIQSIAKARLLATHDAMLAAASGRLNELEAIAAEAANPEIFADWWRVNNAQGSLDGAGRALNDAAKAYENATGKKSAKVRNAWKRHTAVEALIKPIIAAYELKRARAAIESNTREAWQELRGIAKHAYGYRPSRGLGFLRSKIEEALRYLPKEEAAQHAPFLARIGRVDDWHCAVTGLQSAERSFESAMSYLPQYAGDAVREFKQAAEHAKYAKQRHPAFAALHADELAAVAGPDVARLIAEAKERQQREHAAKIDAWKAGEGVSIPYGAGTFARIKGNVVQTSRGASVPLSHACRLARIARRVIAHGGKVWEAGQGPRVGGFQVQSIGADGSAVIGCHEFDGAESMRMLALLDACPECQGIAEEMND